MRPIESDTEHMPELGRQFEKPKDINSNFARAKVYTEEYLIREYPGDDLKPGKDDPRPIPRSKEEENDFVEPREPEVEDEILDSDLPETGSGEDIITPTSSGSKYTMAQAKGQLDGILGQWMDLAGNIPEGPKQDKFFEIGKILRGVSGILNDEFMQGQS
jgi:hypothetical protein